MHRRQGAQVSVLASKIFVQVEIGCPPTALQPVVQVIEYMEITLGTEITQIKNAITIQSGQISTKLATNHLFKRLGVIYKTASYYSNTIDKRNKRISYGMEESRLLPSYD